MAKMNSDPHQRLRIMQHDKFYARLLSKESSLANPSFQVYYWGAAGAVPFVWESRPGTPKVTDATATIPPLPPPPSHRFKPSDSKKRRNKSFIRRTLSTLKRSPRTNTVHVAVPAVSALPRSSTSLSGRKYSSPRSSFSSREEAFVDSVEEEVSTSSVLKGCYPVGTVRNALLAMVCRGQGSGRAAAP